MTPETLVSTPRKPRRSRTARRWSLVAVALVTALFAIPAVASAAKGTTTRADLEGSTGGFCQYTDSSGGPSIGRVEITTPQTATTGSLFVQVDVRIKIRIDKLPAGSYGVYVVNRYRDETGQVVGCSAEPLADALQVTAGDPVDYRGSLERFHGRYEVQVYVGQLTGAGYVSAPAVIDVP